MRLTADTLAPQASVGASRRLVSSGTASAGFPSTAWPATGLYGFAGTKPCLPMVTMPVNTSHVANLTARRLSEASP